MSLKSVTWTSTTLLSCVKCLPGEPSDVILCLADSGAAKLAQRACPLQAPLETTPSTNFPWSTLPAQLTQITRVENACHSQTFFRYSMTYDDSYLLSGQTLLEDDVTGVLCEGCTTEVMRQIAGNDVILQRIVTLGQQDKIRLTAQHGCQYEFSLLKLSADAGNLLTLGSDGGLYLNCAAIAPCLI